MLKKSSNWAGKGQAWRQPGRKKPKVNRTGRVPTRPAGYPTHRGRTPVPPPITEREKIDIRTGEAGKTRLLNLITTMIGKGLPVSQKMLDKLESQSSGSRIKAPRVRGSISQREAKLRSDKAARGGLTRKQFLQKKHHEKLKAAGWYAKEKARKEKRGRETGGGGLLSARVDGKLHRYRTWKKRLVTGKPGEHGYVKVSPYSGSAEPISRKEAGEITRFRTGTRQVGQRYRVGEAEKAVEAQKAKEKIIGQDAYRDSVRERIAPVQPVVAKPAAPAPKPVRWDETIQGLTEFAQQQMQSGGVEDARKTMEEVARLTAAKNAQAGATPTPAAPVQPAALPTQPAAAAAPPSPQMQTLQEELEQERAAMGRIPAFAARDVDEEYTIGSPAVAPKPGRFADTIKILTERAQQQRRFGDSEGEKKTMDDIARIERVQGGADEGMLSVKERPPVEVPTTTVAAGVTKEPVEPGGIPGEKPTGPQSIVEGEQKKQEKKDYMKKGYDATLSIITNIIANNKNMIDEPRVLDLEGGGLFGTYSGEDRRTFELIKRLQKKYADLDPDMLKASGEYYSAHEKDEGGLMKWVIDETADVSGQWVNSPEKRRHLAGLQILQAMLRGEDVSGWIAKLESEFGPTPTPQPTRVSVTEANTGVRDLSLQ